MDTHVFKKFVDLLVELTYYIGGEVTFTEGVEILFEMGWDQCHTQPLLMIG